MVDFIENTINAGDKVVYLKHLRTSSELHMGTVARLTEKTVRIISDRDIENCWYVRLLKDMLKKEAEK